MEEMTIYKIDDLPDFESKLCYFMEQEYTLNFIQYNPNVKKELLSDKLKENFHGSVALLSESFSDLVFLFTLSEIAEMLEKGILLIIKKEPSISQVRIDYFDGEEKLVIGKAEQIEIDTIKAIAFSQIRKKHGRASALLSQGFVRDYWDWQLGNITVRDIMNNQDRDYKFTTKQQFYSLAQRYEQSNSYLMQQEIHAVDLINKKKNGSVNLKAIFDYGQSHPFVALDDKTIPELMEILSVNHIDFWRVIKRFYKSKHYENLMGFDFKESIFNAVKLIDDYKSFFITPDSTKINYGQDISDIICDIKTESIRK